MIRSTTINHLLREAYFAIRDLNQVTTAPSIFKKDVALAKSNIQEALIILEGLGVADRRKLRLKYNYAKSAWQCADVYTDDYLTRWYGDPRVREQYYLDRAFAS